MLKQFAFAVAAAAVSFQAAAACNVTYNTASDKIVKVVRQNGWGFDNYDVICKKLNAANAVLYIHGQATVLGNQSIGWAAVGLKDKNLMIFTNEYSGLSTSTHEYASQDKAEELLMEAINAAVGNVDLDKALASLADSRRQAKAAYGR
ncbi:hypothetical protein LOC51_37215 [Rubrivivax sp. JA1024]|nr:hypothetical protein [Rubrivivax sp. JA1024]